MKQKLFSMKKTILLVLIIISVAAINSCKKQIDQPTQNEAFSTTAQSDNDAISNRESKKVYVSDVDQLYAEINNHENAGATIVLSPGVYTLFPTHPNAGRLELLTDMSLTGQPGRPELTIIDVSNLPRTSNFINNVSTGLVRLGYGDHSIEWLTLRDDAKHETLSLIQTDLGTDGIVKVRVANSIIRGSGSEIGVNIINRLTPPGAYRAVEAKIENNEFFDDEAAIMIQNSRNIEGASITATVRNNYIHGNKIGITVFNGQTGNGNRINLISTANRIEGNGLGVSLEGGFTSSSLNNSVLFKAYGDIIRNNNLNSPLPSSFTIPGGVVVIGGSDLASTLPGTCNNNSVEAHFHDCVIEGNNGNFQVYAFGGRRLNPSLTPVGTYNTAKVYLYGISDIASVHAENSVPAEPAGTNTAIVYRQ